MKTIRKEDIPGLFKKLRDVMSANRETLIELDGKVGDSDLGITMCKAFSAAHDEVSANTADGIGRTIQKAGMAMSKSAPSTMGTLMATGFMRGGKALDGAATIATAEIALFWKAFLDGVVERGKAKRGDKTLVDVVEPILDSLAASSAKGEDLDGALNSAALAAAEALEATKAMQAQHGKAACFQEKTIGLQDAGATVAALVIQAMRDFCSEAGGSA
jgi:dihydroxyacetone kinase-like protein